MRTLTGFVAAAAAPPAPTGTVFAYGVRYVVPGYAGPVLRLRREDTDAEVDVVPDGTTGGVRLADGTPLAAWSGGANLRVARWYNQGTARAQADLYTVGLTYPSGWSGLTATAAQQPRFTTAPTFSDAIGGRIGHQTILGDVGFPGAFTITAWCRTNVLDGFQTLATLADIVIAAGPMFNAVALWGRGVGSSVANYFDGRLQPNVWAHLALTRTATGATCTLWAGGPARARARRLPPAFNGTAIYTGTEVGRFDSTLPVRKPAALYLGIFFDHSQFMWNGRIAEFTMTKGQVLDIATLYPTLPVPV